MKSKMGKIWIVSLLAVSLIVILDYSAKGQESNADDFPNSWVGEWSGNLQIYKATGLSQEVEMKLSIQPTEVDSIYSWGINYAESDNRPYQLIVKDTASGSYVIDELNGIRIENYLIGNVLSSVYEVMGNTIHIDYKKTGDEISFDLIFYKSSPVSTSGGELHQEQEIPEVRTYPVTVRQRAILQKSK